MKLSNLGEFGLIHTIQKLSLGKSPDIVIGIGDDAAALTVSSSALLLATTDMLIEGVHFDLSYTDFNSLGWKSAAVNLSDIAAMGGVPRFCLTSLGIPPHIPVEAVKDFYRGFNALLRTNKTILVGGDTCFSSDHMIISVTLLGEVKRQRVVTRSGAKPGDRIFVTGTLGDSAAGLELLRNAECGMRNGKSKIRNPKSAIPAFRGAGRDANPKSAIGRLVQKHLRPVPRVAWGRKITLAGCASSMIDVSDGLSSDLAHICEESGAGAALLSDRIPLSRALIQSADQLAKPLLQYALFGGEDYELLFTAPLARMKTLQALRIPVTEIGTITTGKKMILVNAVGRKTVLQPTGYDHFKRARD